MNPDPAGDGSPSGGRFGLGLLAVVLLAAVLRFGLLSAFFPSRPVGDEYYYLQTATEIAGGNGHARKGVRHANWPPAHPFLLAQMLEVPPPPGADPKDAVERLLWLQCTLGTLLVLATGLLGRALFTPRTGLVAALVAALYPTFIAFSHFLWSEMLFASLLMSALTAAVRVQRGRRLGTAVVAGLFFGVAGLTREVAILIAGGVAVWWWVTACPNPQDEGPSSSAAGALPAVPVTRARAAGQGLVMLAVAACVVLPWTYRNYKLFDRFVPVSSVSWMAIRQGNTFAKKDWTRPPVGRVKNFIAEYYADPDEMGRADRARAEALALIREEQPAWALKKFVRNTAMLFNPDSFLFKKISRGTYPGLALGWVRFALVASVLAYTVVVGAGVLGIAGARGQGRRFLALGVIGVVVGLHLFALASPRYRMPLMPLLVVFGSHAWLHRREWRLSSPARWVCGAVLLYFATWCLPYFQEDAVSLWRVGTYVDPQRP